jgi:hypothetical protein
LRALGHRVDWIDLYIARFIGEAMTLSLPGGTGIAESTLPSIVHARTNVPRLDVLASSAAKRWTLMRAHALYVIVGGMCGFWVLGGASRTLIGSDALPWIVLLSCALPLVTSLVMQATLSSGVLVRVLGRFRLAKDLLQRTDRSLVVLARSRDLVPLAQLFCAWLCESLETMIVLRVLGAAPSFAMVLSIEAGLSVVRSAVFFAPAGLGVQDLGYLRALDALGMGDVAPAFVVLKRSREIMVALVGWIAFAFLRKRHCMLAEPGVGLVGPKVPVPLGNRP